MTDELQKIYEGIAVRSKVTTSATITGHLEAIMARHKELLALDADEVERLTKVLDATRLAANQCCTGG